MRRAALGVLAVVTCLLVALSLRAHREPPPGFASIRAAREYQDPALLTRAMALPVAARFSPLLFQTNPSACGPASVANVFRSAGEVSTQDEIAAHGEGCAFGVCFGGLTLDELADAARAAHHGWDISVVRPATLEAFRAELARANELDRRAVINFDRFPLFGAGGGHHSPIGGYLEAEDLVLVMDVNADYRPWLVSAPRLFEAMNTLDGSTRRGLLVFTH